MKSLLTVGIFCAILFISGCTAQRQLIVLEGGEYRFFLNKGDVITRENVEPKEITMGYNGVVVSDSEIHKLDKAYELYMLEHADTD